MSAGLVLIIIAIISFVVAEIVKTFRWEVACAREDSGKARNYSAVARHPHTSVDDIEFYWNLALSYWKSTRSNFVSAILSAVVMIPFVIFDAWLIYNFVFNTNWGK